MPELYQTARWRPIKHQRPYCGGRSRRGNLKLMLQNPRQYQTIEEVLAELNPEDRAKFLQWVEPRMRAAAERNCAAEQKLLRLLAAYRLAQQMK
jgi:hypothetical protein